MRRLRRSTSDGAAHFGPWHAWARALSGASGPVAGLATDATATASPYGPQLFVTHDERAQLDGSAPAGAVLAVSAVGPPSGWWRGMRASDDEVLLAAPAASQPTAVAAGPSRAQPPGAVANRGLGLGAGDSRRGSPAVRVRASGLILAGPRAQRAAVYAPLWATEDGGSCGRSGAYPARRASPCGLRGARARS